MTRMSRTDSNSNPIGLLSLTNTVVSSVTITIDGGPARQAILIGQFVAEECNGTYAVGDIQVDGNTITNTQVNHRTGEAAGTVAVSTVVSLRAGQHAIDLRAFTDASDLSVHHRSLSVVVLEPAPPRLPWRIIYNDDGDDIHSNPEIDALIAAGTANKADFERIFLDQRLRPLAETQVDLVLFTPFSTQLMAIYQTAGKNMLGNLEPDYFGNKTEVGAGRAPLLDIGG